MNIDFASLDAQCKRWGVEARHVDGIRQLHLLLAALPTDSRVQLQFGAGHDWQLVIEGRLICGGTFAECVIRLATGTQR